MTNLLIRTIAYEYQKHIESSMNKNSEASYVAMFHQVDDNKARWYDERFAITFQGFTQYIEGILSAGFKIVSHYALCNKELGKQVIITFDDIFEGIYKCVYPYMKSKDLPFVVFPAINNLEEKGYVNSSDLCNMVTNYDKCFVGGNGISHANLRELSPDKSRNEIIGSGEYLEKLLEREIDLFAYPYGSIDAVGKRERKVAGEKYKFAFGTLQANLSVPLDLHYIPRINVNEQNFIYHYK